MADDLLRMIHDGTLAEGTVLHHTGRRHLDRSVRATVVAGGLRLGGKVYRTPSSAAHSITGAPVQGWVFWRLPDGKPVASLRSSSADDI